MPRYSRYWYTLSVALSLTLSTGHCVQFIIIYFCFGVSPRSQKKRKKKSFEMMNVMPPIRIFIYFLFRFICFLTFNFDVCVCLGVCACTAVPFTENPLSTVYYFDFFLLSSFNSNGKMKNESETIWKLFVWNYERDLCFCSCFVCVFVSVWPVIAAVSGRNKWHLIK